MQVFGHLLGCGVVHLMAMLREVVNGSLPSPILPLVQVSATTFIWSTMCLYWQNLDSSFKPVAHNLVIIFVTWSPTSIRVHTMQNGVEMKKAYVLPKDHIGKIIFLQSSFSPVLGSPSASTPHVYTGYTYRQCTHTHTHTHTRMHACMHTHTHTLIHAYLHIHAHSQIYHTHKHTCTLTQRYTNIHINTQIHSDTHTHMHTQTHTLALLLTKTDKQKHS